MIPPTYSRFFCVMSFRSSVSLLSIANLSLLLLFAPSLSAQGPVTAQQIREAYHLYEQEKFIEVVDILESLNKRGALGASEAALLGMSYLNLEKYDDAKRAIDLASWLDPNNYMTLLAEGNLRLLNGDFLRAVEVFSKAHSLYPNRPEARAGLDAALKRRIAALKGTEKTEELEQSYRRYIDFMPTSGDAYAALGTLLFESGRRDEALSYLERAVELDTNAAEPYFIIGKMAAAGEYRNGMNREDARSFIHESIGKAVRLYSMYRMEAARRMQENGGKPGERDERSIEMLKELSESAEEPLSLLREALSLLPELYTDKDEFLADLRRLSEWYPSSAEIQEALAEAYFNTGRKEAAEEVWSNLIRRFPLNYKGHLGLGQCRMERRDYRGASLSLRRALDISPRTEELYVLLQRLYRRWQGHREFLEILEQRMLKDGYNPVLYRFAADTAHGLGLEEKAGEYRRSAEQLAAEREKSAEKR